MMVCAGIANTGYLGVPLARSLFDESQAVGQAITYDVVVSATFLLLVGFAIGAGFGTRAGDTPRERLRSFFVRNPPLFAFLLALIAPQAPEPRLGARRGAGRGARASRRSASSRSA